MSVHRCDGDTNRILNWNTNALQKAAEQQRMLAFLDVPSREHPLTPQSVKQNPTDLRQLIANFDELAAALRDSPLREELDDQDD